MTIDRTYRFYEVFQEEIELINLRRHALGRVDFIALEIEPDARFGLSDSEISEPATELGSPSSRSVSDLHRQNTARPEQELVLRPTAGSNVVGLALSGGGIRSASFCLGASCNCRESDKTRCDAA